MERRELTPGVFEFRDYKEFLRQVGASRPRGYRKALAKATRCQTAYITHVLGGKGHFNLDQAEAAARFLELGREEVRYFLTLVEFNRAGTPTLRSLLKEQLDEMKEKRESLMKRIGMRSALSRENQATYYSTWQFAAVHMAVTIPALRTRAALGRALRIPSRKVAEILDFLMTVGLVRADGERFLPGADLIHLDRGSPLIQQHHANWRTRAMISLQNEDNQPETVHYSAALTISAEDLPKVHALIIRDLGNWLEVVKPSKEEQLHALSIDFFRLDRPSD